MTKKSDYTDILLEEIRDQNNAVLEAVTQLQDKAHKLATKDDLFRVESKVDTIQTAVKATNLDVASLDQRVTDLEQS